MKYKKLSECMTRQEVDMLMEVLLPGSKVKTVDRLKDSNCINVTFEYEGREEILIFYPDDCDNVPEGVVLENENFYQIYMIMNGYSRIWEGEADLKTGEWIAAASEKMKSQKNEQGHEDTILLELMGKSRNLLQELREMLNNEPEGDKLDLYQQISEEARERLEHISYVRGIYDAVMMLRTMNERVNLPNMATELEDLLLDYNHLYGLVETFGDGAKSQLGNYDVTKGIFAIATSLEELNVRLNTLFEKVIGEDE